MLRYLLFVFIFILGSTDFSFGQAENDKCALPDGETFWKFECKQSCEDPHSTAIGKCDDGLRCCYDVEPKCDLDGLRNPNFICKEKCDGDYSISLVGNCGEDHECCTIITNTDLSKNVVEHVEESVVDPKCDLAGSRNPKFICKEKCDGDYSKSLLGHCGTGHECCTIITSTDIWTNVAGLIGK